jgi:hypothetical protein
LFKNESFGKWINKETRVSSYIICEYTANNWFKKYKFLLSLKFDLSFVEDFEQIQDFVKQERNLKVVFLLKLRAKKIDYLLSLFVWKKFVILSWAFVKIGPNCALTWKFSAKRWAALPRYSFKVIREKHYGF